MVTGNKQYGEFFGATDPFFRTGQKKRNVAYCRQMYASKNPFHLNLKWPYALKLQPILNVCYFRCSNLSKLLLVINL